MMAFSIGESSKVEVIIYGGKPWGFTLDGGCDYFDLLIVTKIDPLGKSCRVGLEVGDVIEAVNGEKCSSRREAVDLIQTSSTVLHLMIRKYSNRAALVQQCISNARSNLSCYPRRKHLRLSKSAGDLSNIKDDRRVNVADSLISSGGKPPGSCHDNFGLVNKRDDFLRSSFEESNSSDNNSGYFVKHGRSYSLFESNRRSSRKYSRATKLRSEPAFDVYPRSHSMGYSLEVIPDSKERNSILPRCTVLNREGQHQISVSEDFLRRHSIATERTFANSEFAPHDHNKNVNTDRNFANSISHKRASLFVERGGVDSLFMQPKTFGVGYVGTNKDKDVDLSNKEPEKSAFSGSTDALLAYVSSKQVMPPPPLPPARNSSMYAVHEIGQHRGVWSRNTKAVAQVKNLNINVAASVTSAEKSELLATTKQSETFKAAMLDPVSISGPSKANNSNKLQSYLTAPNSSEFVCKSFPNQSQFVSRPHSSADLIDEDHFFAHQPFHLMDRPHTATDMYSNTPSAKPSKDLGITPIENELKAASHESLGNVIARSSPCTPDRILNEKFRPDLRSTDSLQGYARSGSEEKHEFDSRQKEKVPSSKWGVSFEGLSPESNIFAELSDNKCDSRDIENGTAILRGAAGGHDSVNVHSAQANVGRLLPNCASYSKSYQKQSSSSSFISSTQLSTHAVNSNSSKLDSNNDDRSMVSSSFLGPENQPPLVPARDSSKCINFADYKRYPPDPTLFGQPAIPVAVARKCVVVDPVSLKQLSPAKKTAGLNSSSTCSPFHKPLPNTPPNINILESNNSKEKLDSSLGTGNALGAKSSVNHTKSATFDLSHLTEAKEQQQASSLQSKNSTYFGNQNPKAIPAKTTNSETNYQDSLVANFMDQKRFRKSSHERSLSSGVADVSMNSPEKSVFSSEPNETPPMVPPKLPRSFLSSTPLADQLDSAHNKHSSPFDNLQTESRTQWVPERVRKITAGASNSAANQTSTYFISDIATEVTPQPRFLSDPSGEARSPANRRRDHVRSGNISDPQGRVSYRGVSHFGSGVSETLTQDVSSSFEPTSILCEESLSRLSSDSQTGHISPISVVAFAQKGIFGSNTELTDKETWPDANNSEKTSTKRTFTNGVRANPNASQLRDMNSAPVGVEVLDLNSYPKEDVSSAFVKPIPTGPRNQTEKKEPQTQRKTSFSSNHIPTEQVSRSTNQRSENYHKRVSPNLSDTGFVDTSGSADIYGRDPEIALQEESGVLISVNETQASPEKLTSEMMLARPQNDSSLMENQLLLSSGGEHFNGVDSKVRERILNQRRVSRPCDLTRNKNLRDYLRKELRREERTKSQSDALDEDDSAITSSKLEDSLDNQKNPGKVMNPSQGTNATAKQANAANSEQCIDDADEHLAGSNQSQFRIAKFRFLRRQDEMRVSQRGATRPIMPSKHNSSIRLRIAKSTENISNTSNINSISFNDNNNNTNNGGTTGVAGFSSISPAKESAVVGTETSRLAKDNFIRNNRSLACAAQPVNSNITRQFSKSAANISDLMTLCSNVTQEDSGLGLGAMGSSGLGGGGASCEEIRSSIGLKSGGLNESKNSLFSNSRTMSSDDLSASAVTGCTGASQGFLSRTGSLDNLLADFDGDQVQSALCKIQDMLERERGELKELLANLFEENKSDCEQIVAAIQQKGRETDVKRFNRYLESLCTSCKLAVHEESRLTKLDSRMTELANRSACNLNSNHETTSNSTTTTQRSQKSIEKEIEHIRRTCEKQKVKVAEAISAFEDAETTLLKHLEKVLRNAPEDLQTSRTKIESRIELTRKICLSESNIKSNEEIEKILKKQLVTSSGSS